MHCRPRLVCGLLIVFVLLSGACSRKVTSSGPRRIVVKRFENLSSDPSYDWLSEGIAGVLISAYTEDKNVVAAGAQTDIEAGLRRPTELISGYYALEDGRLKIYVFQRDYAAQKTISTPWTAGSADDPLSVIAATAKNVTSHEPYIGTRSVQAVKSFWSSLEAGSPAEATARLQAAIAADPAYVWPRLLLTQQALNAGDRATVQAQLPLLTSQASSVPAFLKARIAVVQARYDQNRAEQLRALQQLVEVTPASDEAWRNLAEARLQAKDVTGTIEALQQARNLDPRSVPVLNLLAYSYALQGRVDDALKTVDEYEAVAPNDGNVADTRGDVLFYSSRFREAEQSYQEAHRRNSSLLGGGDLYRAALARYFSGDTTGADNLFLSFLEFRRTANDPFLPLREAIWEASTGRIDQGRKRLAQYAQRADVNPGLRILAQAQQSLFGGVAPPQLPGNAPPALANVVAMAQYVTQANATPASLLESGKRFGPLLVCYALLNQGHPAEAAPVCESVYANSPANNDSDARIALAWAYSASGQGQKAAPLLAHPPLPPSLPDPGLGYHTIAKSRELKPR